MYTLLTSLFFFFKWIEREFLSSSLKWENY